MYSILYMVISIPFIVVDMYGMPLVCRVGWGNTLMRGDRPMPILELTYIARTFIFYCF